MTLRGSLRRHGVPVFVAVSLLAPARAAVMTDGPIVGGVEPQTARVFARTDVAGDVQIQYHAASGPCAGTIVTAAITTQSAHDFTTIVELTGLCASTQYFYNVLVDGVPQLAAPEPSFVTFPEAGTSVPFTFAVVSDLRGSDNEASAPAPVYAAVKNENPAFVMQIGDFDHRDPQGLDTARAMIRDVRGPTSPSGLDFLNNIARSFPFFHMWDDHDYGKDNADKRFAGKVSARRAFEEYYPTPPMPNPNVGLWHSFRYGQAEFFLMDLRSQRDPDYDPDDAAHSMLDGDNIVDGQKDWLKNGLLASTARWKFLISTVSFNRNSGKRDDSWMGFLIERTEIVNFIRSHDISGVILVSGDLHSGGMIDNGANSDFPEISVSHTNLNRGGIGPCTGVGCRDFWAVGTISGADSDGGYALIRVGTSPDTVTLQAKDGTGAVLLEYVEDCSAHPSEAQSLTLSSTKERLNWEAPADRGGLTTAVLYDTIRSSTPSDFLSAAICVDTNDAAVTATDTAVPAPGSGFYYRVRAENACGQGSPGAGSDGVPVVARTCP